MSESALRATGFVELTPERLAGLSVLIAGAGNLGSFVAPLVARAGVGRVTIVDRDRVEAKNLTNQDYRPEDVGRFKAEALAERLARQFATQRFDAQCCDLEVLARETATVHVAFGCLDSRRARQVLVSELCWPLRVPVVDGGVGEGLRGRVQVFVPSAETACLECTWGTQDYRLLADEYPCVPGAAAAGAPTLSPAFAGSLTAGVMLAQGLRLLAQWPTESYEIAFDLRHDVLRRFTLRRATRCRYDHVSGGNGVQPGVARSWALRVGD